MSAAPSAVGRDLGARRLAEFAVTVAALVLSGCAGDGPPPNTGGSTFDQVQTQIFTPHCASGACHGAAASGGLNLQAGSSYGDLVGVTPTNQAAIVAGYKRVIPFDPANSFLLVKLTLSGPNQFESPMPLGFPPLSPSQIALVQQWITEGAPPPSGPTTPSATLSPVPTPSDTPSPTETPPPSDTPTLTATPTQTPLPSITATGTLPPTPTSTMTATVTSTSTATATATVPPTPTFDPESTLVRLQETIFTPTCAMTFCHDSITESGGLILTAVDVSFAHLVGVEPDNAKARSDGMLRVEAFNPDNSFLITKVIMPTFDIELGSPMPLVGNRLTEHQVEQLRAWIFRGAKEFE